MNAVEQEETFEQYEARMQKDQESPETKGDTGERDDLDDEFERDCYDEDGLM